MKCPKGRNETMKVDNRFLDTADDETKEILKDKFERKLIEAICLHADDMKIDINALKKFGVEISKEDEI